eukprot:CAMPEP_0185466294 /NCGR_PEP_ID=MMETSP1365-20130426/96659_1 /TAXON_ID=38817 /ORGANISM="Gephyrocapsa oceanica, Strain RCC1303" /LENGTH=249 /DNA_ID=CAMNT_0028073031 /DNA_START=624 /DNA_END=1375 /DNA_ORIENTATION=-
MRPAPARTSARAPPPLSAPAAAARATPSAPRHNAPHPHGAGFAFRGAPPPTLLATLTASVVGRDPVLRVYGHCAPVVRFRARVVLVLDFCEQVFRGLSSSLFAPQRAQRHQRRVITRRTHTVPVSPSEEHRRLVQPRVVRVGGVETREQAGRLYDELRAAGYRGSTFPLASRRAQAVPLAAAAGDALAAAAAAATPAAEAPARWQSVTITPSSWSVVPTTSALSARNASASRSRRANWRMPTPEAAAAP